MTTKLLIFDCDGVLVDSEVLSHRILVEMLGNEGFELSQDDAMDKFLGRSTTQATDILSGMMGEQAAGFMSRFKQRVSIAFRTELRAVAGVEAALDRLNVPFCVASSGELEKMSLTLGITGLLRRFEGKLTSVTEVPHPKPAPDVYLLAAKRMGVAPADCAVVEDSPTGVAAGVAAGMKVFGYAASTPPLLLLQAGAHRVFDSMTKLPELIGTD